MYETYASICLVQTNLEKDARESVESDEHSGTPAMSWNEKQVTTCRLHCLKNCRIVIRELCDALHIIFLCVQSAQADTCVSKIRSQTPLN